MGLAAGRVQPTGIQASRLSGSDGLVERGNRNKKEVGQKVLHPDQIHETARGWAKGHGNSVSSARLDGGDEPARQPPMC